MISDILDKVAVVLIIVLVIMSAWTLITEIVEPALNARAEKAIEPLCMDTLDRSIETTDLCIRAWEGDQRTRQTRIFKWELCSGLENCWNCISQTAEGSDNGVGDVEFCFKHACDGISDGQCTEVLEDMLRQYFETPDLGDPV